MRSNSLNKKMLWQTAKEFLRVIQTVMNWLTLGLSGRQWLTSLLIGLLLAPVFSVPVQATININNNFDANANKFEPVNAPQWFWESAAIKLNIEIDEWLTPRREGNGLVDAEVKFANDEKTSEVRKEKINLETRVEENSAVLSKNEVADVKTATDNLKDEELNPKNAVNLTTKVAAKNSSASAPRLVVNQLPADQRDSIYSYENNLGAPPGQTEMDSANEAAATRIRHRAGIANFSFGVPLAALAGRGIDAEIGMTYNSRTWNKSLTTDPNNPEAAINHYTYDVEQSWIAPGFSSGFGYLETQAVTRDIHPEQSSNFTYHTEITPLGITDPDGTRHQMRCSSWSAIPGSYSSRCTAYSSADGTFHQHSGRRVGEQCQQFADTEYGAVC